MDAPGEAFSARWDETCRIVRIEWIPGAALTLHNAKLITEMALRFTADPPLVLVDVRGLTGKLDRAGRRHLVDELDKLTAMALLVDSALSTMIANIFIRMQRRRIPMMLFTQEQHAVDWLIARRG